MKLDQYLASNALTNAAFAALIGVNPATVSRFRNGGRRPDLGTAQRIHEVTKGKVKAEDFFAAQPEPVVTRARKRKASA